MDPLCAVEASLHESYGVNDGPIEREKLYCAASCGRFAAGALVYGSLEAIDVKKRRADSTRSELATAPPRTSRSSSLFHLIPCVKTPVEVELGHRVYSVAKTPLRPTFSRGDTV